MKRKIGVSIGVALIIVAGVVYYVSKAPKKAPEDLIPSYLVQPQVQAMKEFQPENASFTVLLPTPVTHATTTKSYNGSHAFIRYDVYSATGSDGTGYLLSRVQYPASFDVKDPSVLFQSLLHNMATSMPDTEIIGQNPTTFLNYPAFDFNIQNLKYATVGRAVLAGHTLYVLTVMSPDRNTLESDFHTFANSLILREPIVSSH